MPAINLEPISRQVERYMMDEVTIRRPQPPALNSGTLLLTKTWIEIYSGKAFIVPEGTPYPHNLGGGQYSDTRFEIAIPAATDPVLPNDEVTCDTSVYNEWMEGIMFIVVGQVESTFFTHRRLTCYKEQDAQ
jgi:hypothetical protein